MAIIIAFLFGVANFAMHKAVQESGHPLLAELPRFIQAHGGRVGFVFEFLLLLGTMLMVAEGSMRWGWAYGGYSLANGLSAWLIMTRRI